MDLIQLRPLYSSIDLDIELSFTLNVWQEMTSRITIKILGQFYDTMIEGSE